MTVITTLMRDEKRIPVELFLQLGDVRAPSLYLVCSDVTDALTYCLPSVEARGEIPAPLAASHRCSRTLAGY